MQEMKAKKKEIELRFDMKYEKYFFVNADREKIFNVINNIIDNSIKYGKIGGRTTVVLMEMGQDLLIEISDNGIGIAQDELHRIFERFYRTDRGRSREMGGTGLGLSIVKHIIEAHHKTINVRSTMGEGTTFSFSLQKA